MIPASISVMKKKSTPRLRTITAFSPVRGLLYSESYTMSDGSPARETLMSFMWKVCRWRHEQRARTQSAPGM